uniref:Uncharacterized protein n=1 Tax=Oryza sativa subsp. japonica TaxID=39947 RepID=Q5Z5R0_ORYSJ|nr:hypothetical protein [Oryza sativa Japonica Group]BAD62007.1 hypothetical protein [Oryza sativa Japonica Group]
MSSPHWGRCSKQRRSSTRSGLAPLRSWTLRGVSDRCWDWEAMVALRVEEILEGSDRAALIGSRSAGQWS